MEAWFADGVLRSAFQSMLASDHRSSFARLQVARNQQKAVGNDIRKYIQHHFVAGPFVFLVSLPGPRIGWQQRLLESSNNLFREKFPVWLRSLAKTLKGTCIQPFHELLPDIRALDQQSLRKRV